MRATGYSIRTWSGHLKLVALSLLFTPVVAAVWGWFRHTVLGSQPFLDSFVNAPLTVMASSLFLAYPIVGCVYLLTGRPRFLADQERNRG